MQSNTTRRNILTRAGLLRQNEILIAILLCAAIAVGGYMMQYIFFPAGLMQSADERASTAVTEISPITAIRINEIMTSNKSALRDDAGLYPDWVELYNAGDHPVDITGWMLTERTKKSKLFVFPNQILAPGEFVIVFASNKLENEANRPYHAPFKLSSGGDSLMLFDGNSKVVESVNIPPLMEDQVYARSGSAGDWMITSEYTPRFANTRENHAALTDRTPAYEVTLFINEIVADNATGIKDEDGENHDYFELYNAGTAPVVLANYAVSDDAATPDKWTFPDVVIEPGAYLCVFASGKDRRSDTLHTNFSLRAEGERLLLSDADGKLLADIAFDNLKPDQALIRNADGSYAISTPSPGGPN